MRKRTWAGTARSIVLAAILLSCGHGNGNPAAPSESTGRVDADHPFIRFIGRADRTHPKAAAFDWPGTGVSAAFEGTSCSVRLTGGGNYFSVSIDGATAVILQSDSAGMLGAASGLRDTVHSVTVRKRTEAFVGRAVFEGFVLDRGKTLAAPAARPDRRIEVIGNSITCGYGVEGASASCRFSPETEDATKSYPDLIAAAVGAEVSLVAYSGRGVVRNYGDANKTSTDPMPSLIDRTCFSDAGIRWDFASWIPQAVFVNLGTNDYSTEPHPDKPVFQAAYVGLVTRVLGWYPGVKIFCLSGPMIGSPCLEIIREAVEGMRSDGHAEDVFFIEVPQRIMTSTDWGCDWHPNVRGQRKIADAILPEFRRVMNW
jgi:hypothetical protein